MCINYVFVLYRYYHWVFFVLYSREHFNFNQCGLLFYNHWIYSRPVVLENCNSQPLNAPSATQTDRSHSISEKIQFISIPARVDGNESSEVKREREIEIHIYTSRLPIPALGDMRLYTTQLVCGSVALIYVYRIHRWNGWCHFRLAHNFGASI